MNIKIGSCVVLKEFDTPDNLTVTKLEGDYVTCMWSNLKSAGQIEVPIKWIEKCSDGVMEVYNDK